MGSKWKYVRDSPLTHDDALAAPGDYDNAWLQIRRRPDGSSTTIAAHYAWDGCTLAPDLRGTCAASCLHDAVYQFAEDIAACWDWPLRRVLRWGDELFRSRMRRDGAPRLIIWLYYWAVRLLGAPYHVLARRVRQLRKLFVATSAGPVRPRDPGSV
ncbi:MAG: hypothetical protein PHR35_04695 [Kiritimatiellae bacterium]|nr:hypothetical protein [Kiritimatiellia bacterium]